MAVIEGIGDWMKVNGEAIYGTRPWTVYGEGPSTENVAAINAQGFNEGKAKPYTAQDIRFTSKGKFTYAILMAWPEDKTAIIRSLAAGSVRVSNITIPGTNNRLPFEQSQEGLKITLPDSPPCKDAYALKIET